MQQFERSLRAFQKSDLGQEDLHKEAEIMSHVPQNDKELVSIDDLAQLIKRLNSGPYSYQRHYLSERMMVYDFMKRGITTGYAPVVEQVVRAWNRTGSQSFSFDYNEPAKTLRISGTGLRRLESKTSMGPGKCLLRFLSVEVLDISGTSVEDLTQIKELIHLKTLDIRDTPVSSLSFHTNHPALHTVVMTEAQQKTLDTSTLPDTIKILSEKPVPHFRQ